MTVAATAAEPPSTGDLDPVSAYAWSVVEGERPAGHLVRQACERHLWDMDQGHLRGLWFDIAEAVKAIRFFRFLRHYKGEWAGQPVILEAWQEFIIGSIFGCKRADGTRRFPVAYVEVPRKNGKSLLAAGVGLRSLSSAASPKPRWSAAATKSDGRHPW